MWLELEASTFGGPENQSSLKGRGIHFCRRQEFQPASMQKAVLTQLDVLVRVVF
jgi:hypothetical protein